MNGIPEAEEESFHGLLHVELIASADMKVADLRDPQLDKLDLKLTTISSGPSQHYPCSRTVAKAIHASTQNFSVIIWHSPAGRRQSTAPSTRHCSLRRTSGPRPGCVAPHPETGLHRLLLRRGTASAARYAARPTRCVRRGLLGLMTAGVSNTCEGGTNCQMPCRTIDTCQPL